ncbi:uncharacterized protein EI90DRAFT_3092003 [Cantharellus anzutake]|uniref:uncharacterized protein n=1 Tax=Cantharellus anzutake TaxID=1750568 RepID=UPI001904A6B0|nr:uncharacterized protein EI90DRAFT_3092003 [Cantharellus anzutake]KAF8313339.1 hypothetical protein EI90DRAFT_3092003 [Cantharellus anzutake]
MTTYTRLDDSADVFEDFVNLLYDPFNSPLFPTQGTQVQLKPVLHILQIAYKYHAKDIEKRASAIAEELTQPRNLPSHLGISLTCIDIFRIAINVKRIIIAENAWKVMVTRFLSGELDSRSLLDEAMGQPRFLGSAYYIVMLGGPHKWREDPKLSIDEVSRLSQAFQYCMEEWDGFVSRVAQSNLDIPKRLARHRVPAHPCPEDRNTHAQTPAVRALVRTQTRTPSPNACLTIMDALEEVPIDKYQKHCGLRAWDLLGKLTEISRGWQYSHIPDLAQCAKNTLAAIEAEMPTYFALDDDTFIDSQLSFSAERITYYIGF